MCDALPNASFVGFTGTPLELDDRNTWAVFGDYISIYDIFENMPQKNLAVELLRKLLEGKIGGGRLKNVVQARSFAELLERAVRRQNRAVEAVQVIEELIALAKEMRKADRRREQLGLSEEELAFYDALEINDSAVKGARRADAVANCQRTGFVPSART